VERRFAERRLDLPMLPDVATRILAGGLDDTVAVEAIADLLRLDQAITGHVLRIANSPAYSHGARIQSIQQALMRIGLAQLREIVVAVALRSRVFRGDGFEEIVAALWKHSAVAGAYAKEIARLLRVNVEGAFVCGLLHDVGKPVVLALLLDLQRETRAPLSRATSLETLDAYHAGAGAALAREWDLPDPVTQAIAHHHDPGGAPGHVQAVMITCLADLLSHATLCDAATREETETAARQHPVCGLLNLYPDDLDALLARRPAMRELQETLGR
jgi:putative nucleotidyltransferase with HDIG domain